MIHRFAAYLGKNAAPVRYSMKAVNIPVDGAPKDQSLEMELLHTPKKSIASRLGPRVVDIPRSRSPVDIRRSSERSEERRRSVDQRSISRRRHRKRRSTRSRASLRRSRHRRCAASGHRSTRDITRSPSRHRRVPRSPHRRLGRSPSRSITRSPTRSPRRKRSISSPRHKRSISSPRRKRSISSPHRKRSISHSETRSPRRHRQTPDSDDVEFIGEFPPEKTTTNKCDGPEFDMSRIAEALLAPYRHNFGQPRTYEAAMKLTLDLVSIEIANTAKQTGSAASAVNVVLGVCRVREKLAAMGLGLLLQSDV